MRIGFKLMLGFALMALIAGVVGFVGILNIRTMEDAASSLYEKMTVPLGTLAKITMGSQRLRINVREYVEAQDPGRREKMRETCQGLIADLRKQNDEFEKTILTEGGRNAFKKYEGALEKYVAAFEKIKEKVTAGKYEEAANIVGGEGYKAAQELRAEVDELVRLKLVLSKENADENVATARKATLVMAVALVFGILFAVAAGIVLTISITRPLAAGVNFAQKVAGGDLTATVNVDNKDELGDLARALNETVSRLKDSMMQISEASSQVNSASGQIAQGNQDLSARTEQQAAAVEETAASMEEMATSIKSNTQNAQEVNNLAIDASNKAGAGVGVVGDVVTAMTGITESSQKIGQIIEVMNNIAFQTNLLALNASIEAARAGEQGRGFAVVAVEVRKLAQRSEEASREITQLIQESNSRVGTGAELVKKAGTSLDDINAAVGKVKNLVAEISAASQEQLTGVDQINKTIISLDQNTQQNSSLVEESASAAEELSSQAQELFAIVSQFKIGDTKSPTPSRSQEGTNRLGHGDTKSKAPSRSQDGTNRLGHGDTKSKAPSRSQEGANHLVHGDTTNRGTKAKETTPVAHANGEAKSMTLHPGDGKKEGFVEF